jgi:hypothetical protein
MIAQQTDWSNPRNWMSQGNTMQKRSDQWSPDNGTTYPGSEGYWLTNGQRYYLEAVHHEGSGGDNVGVTYAVYPNTPNDGDETLILGNTVGTMAPRSRAWFTQEPASTVAAPYTYARFTVAGGSDSTLPINSRNNYVLYQWQRNGSDIPGATSQTLSHLVLPGDNGVQFSCKIRSLGLVDNSLNRIWTNSAAATLTVQGVFEPGYTTVEFWANTTTKNGVLNNTIGVPTYITTSPAYEANTDGPGDPPNGVNDYARRVSGYFVPSSAGVYDFFVTADDDCNVYLSQTLSPADKVLICQEVGWSGGSRQWQSPGDATANPLSQRRSDQWTNTLGEVVHAAGFSLNAGQKYYLEAVQHEGGGGDYVQVTAVKRPGPAPVNGEASALTGNVIGTYVPKSTMVAFTAQPTNVIVNGPVVAYFYAGGISDSKLSVGVIGQPVTNRFVIYQWQKNGVDIPGATSAALAYQVTSGADHNASFVCKIRGLGYSDASLNPIWSNSQPAILTIDDPSVPTMVYASRFTDINLQPNVEIVDILFSKRMDPTTLLNAANYSIPGLTITGITVRSNDYRAVRLTVTGTPGAPFNVTVNNLADYKGTALVSGSALAISNVGMISKDIGFERGSKTNDIGTIFPLLDPQFPSVFWVDGSAAYTVSAQGSDIWGTNDGFNFVYEMKIGDFDVAVRQLSITRSDYWAKSGLMLRETLNPSSRHWSIFNTPLAGAQDAANRVVCNNRKLTAGASTDWHQVDPVAMPAPAYPNAWLRLKRTGNVLTAYASTNGVNWVQWGTDDASQGVGATPLPNELYVGIATTGHGNDEPDALVQTRWNTSSYANYMAAIPGAPVLQTSVSGNSLTLSWSPAVGQLVSSPTLGPSAVWTPVPNGGASPVTVTMGATPVYFRVLIP